MSFGGDPPDPTATANQQQQYNLNAGIASQAGSMVNQVTPYGTLSFSQTGTGPSGVPIYTATTKLNPQSQQILDILQGNQAVAGKQAGDTLTRANYGASDPASVIGDATSGATKDMMNKAVSYLSPYYQTQTDQLDTKLRNQGFQPGDTAYDQAMNGLKQNQNQSITGALLSIEPTAYSQAQQNYLMPLQTAMAEQGLVAPPDLKSSTVGTPGIQVNAPDYEGDVYKSYQLQQQANQAMMSGLFGIPTAVLGGWAKSGGIQAGLPAMAAMI